MMYFLQLESWNEYDTKITTAIASDKGRMEKLKAYQDNVRRFCPSNDESDIAELTLF